MRRSRVLGALVLVAIVGAGCADDDDEVGSGDTTPTTASVTAATTASPEPEPAPPTTTTAVATPTTVDEGAGEARPSALVPVPALEGPITGGTRGIHANPMPPGMADEAGYTDEEFFVAGEARAHHATAPLTADGTWAVEPAETAAYRTRIIVRRPVDPAAFNGTLVVEWLNVSAGRDSDPDFGFLHPELLAGGYAYVGVSAQRTGIGGGGAILEIPGVPEEALAPLTVWDPERYGTLVHPGDAWSYDMYSQAAQAVLAHGDVDPLDGLAVDHVLAVGESQAAFRMVTYANAVQPVAQVFDGFLVHSRSGGAAALSDDPADAVPEVVHIRTDLDAPVLQFETETDLTFLGFVAARQPDSDRVATWEVAGTAHADQATVDYGAASGAAWGSTGGFDPSALCGAVNTGPQGPVLRAALVALRTWVVDGTAPPPSDRIAVDGGAIVRDDDGIARGGIRTPVVDAPVATLSGETTAESVFCSLFGSTVPFTDEQLARYPSSAAYLEEFTPLADLAVEAGFLLPADRDALVAAAEAVRLPG